MPRRNSLINRLVHGRAWDEWDEDGDAEDAAVVAATDTAKPRSRRRRVAVALTFATLFVAGAAFSAAAGDQVRSTLDDSTVSGQAATDGTTTDESTPAATDPAPAVHPAPADSTPAPAEAPPAPAEAPAAPSDAAAPQAAVAPVSTPAASVAASTAVQQAATRSGTVSGAAKAAGSKPAARRRYASTMRSQARHHHFPKRKAPRPPKPELEGATSAVVWLNRALPDPTPPALRLKPRFAKHLKSVARANHVSWALMLGVLGLKGTTAPRRRTSPA